MAHLTLLVTDTANASPEPEQERVFVLPTQAENTLSAFAEAVGSELPGAIRVATEKKVLGVADLEAILNSEKMKDLAGCDKVSCYSEIASALGARWLVRSTLEASGEKLTLRGVLLDATSLTVVRSVERRVLRDGVVLKFATRDIVHELFGVATKRSEANLSLPTEYDAREGRRNGVSAANQEQLDRRAQTERLAMDSSGMPPDLWIGENWTAYQWQQFQASGLSRREYIDMANKEATWPFVLELALGGVAAVGIPLGVGLAMKKPDEPAMFAPALVGGMALVGLAVTLLFDGLANPNLKYLGDQP